MYVFKNTFMLYIVVIKQCFQRPQVPVQSFTVMAQSCTLLRIAYQGMYCLELRIRGGGLVTVRDGAYSHFDRSNVVDVFTPTQGLRAFLSKYVDESAVFRRRSQSEDDNPPSPISMEVEGGNFLGKWIVKKSSNTKILKLLSSGTV